MCAAGCFTAVFVGPRHFSWVSHFSRCNFCLFVFRTINALFGLLAIKLSKDVIWEEDYVPNRGPFCAICERRVPFLSYASRQACRTCSSRITRDYYAPVTGYPIRTDVRRGVNPETLYYLCIRKSGTPGELQETSFTDMIESITQSQLYANSIFWHFNFPMAQLH